MSRDIAPSTQNNLWGKQADVGGLEPQRVDLFFVDFKNALNGIKSTTALLPLAFGTTQFSRTLLMAPMLPQYVRSISMPEIRTKPDTIRRDSLPFNMPSWDDPLDPVKLIFLLDTHFENERCDVIEFLDAWLALTRAGRGSRAQGYYGKRRSRAFTLNADYSVDFMYDISLSLLRGADSATVRQFFTSSAPSHSGLALHSIYVLKNAWLAAYKLGDFTYMESNLTTVEATFYVDSVDLFDDSPTPSEGTVSVTLQ